MLMKKKSFRYIKETLIPLLLFSSVAGIFTGIIIFLFKIASTAIIGWSGEIYGFVRTTPIFIPLLLIGAAAVGAVAALILRVAPDCRGGGIPSAIAALRGVVPIHRAYSLPLIFFSSTLTYLCGVPLGTEGPSVQMGTLVGWITSKLLGKKNRAWHRYVMTGGACAGFGAATGAPLTGIFFAFEEAHRRFTPMIFMTASLTTLFSSVTMELLCMASGTSPKLFGFSIDAIMPVEYMWSALIIGVVCGVAAIFFTKTYKRVHDMLERHARRIPFVLRIIIIFVLTAIVGLVSSPLIGTGHHLIDELIEGHGVWYMLIIFLLVRSIFLMIANTQGVTGGLFIPSLAIGAMIGTLCAKGMIGLGILPSEYGVICIVIGMVSFLSASSRVPITALAFSLEALSGHTNFLPIATGVAVAFAVIEVVGIHSFNDVVVDMKIEEYNKGRELIESDVELVVQKDAFVISKEIKDVLWPPNCVVIPVIKASRGPAIGEGDLLRVHCRTHHPEFIEERLEELLGKQYE